MASRAETISPWGVCSQKQMHALCLYLACVLQTRGSHLRHEVALGSPAADSKDVSRSKQGRGVARPQWVKARALCGQCCDCGMGLICWEKKREWLRWGNVR